MTPMTNDNDRPNPVPDGYRSITPYLKLPSAGRLVEFLKKAFDGIEKGRLLKPDGSLLHAEVLIGDSLVMVHDAPSQWKSQPSTLYLYVGDVDATYKRAIEAGGVSMFEPTNMYFGDRVAGVTDVSENDWWIATRLQNSSVAEVQERATTLLKARSEHGE
jgi:PhnB protein